MTILNMLVNKLLHTFTYYIVTVTIIAAILLTLDHTHFNGFDDEKKRNDGLLQKFFNRIYFCSTTLSTVGYGDVSPKSNLARGISILLQFIATVGVIAVISS
jgi:Trk-type K+ transport system membrane component